MNLSQLTDDQMRIAIAEACGWTKPEIAAYKTISDLRVQYRKLPRRDSFSGWGIADKIEAAENSNDYRGDIPDYLNSLDAMHEAEKMLDARQQDVFALNLAKLVEAPYRVDFGRKIDTSTKILFATARQRAQAFLATIHP